MAYMFDRCKEFEQDISGWDTAEVTSMAAMFHSFNSAVNLEEWVRIIIPLCLPPLSPLPPHVTSFFSIDF